MTNPKGMVIEEPKHGTNYTHTEAMEYYNEASRLIEKYRPVKPSALELPFLSRSQLNDTHAIIMASTMVPSLIYWLIVPESAHLIPHESLMWINAIGILFSASFIGGNIGLGILSWDGNPKKRIRSLLSSIFLAKKAKKKIEAYRKNRSDYQNSVKMFELYVQKIREVLNDSGVMKALDESSGGTVHYYIADDGIMHSKVRGVETPDTGSKNSLNSSQKIAGMAKELVQSVSTTSVESNIVKVEK